MVMESNAFTLSKPLRNGIQGLVGELVGLEYVLNNLKTDENDAIYIVTNRHATIQTHADYRYPGKAHPLAVFRRVDKSPLEFLCHDLVNEFHKIGCEGIDFTNAGIEAEYLFDKYMSKTKKQILSELERLERLDRKEEEKAREEREKAREQFVSRINEIKKESFDMSEIVNTLSHEDLAKVLTLIKLEKKWSLNTFFKNYLRNVEWAEHDYKNRRDEIKIISEHANAKFEKWKIFSSVFNCLYPFHSNHPITKIDSMIVHYHGEKLNKLIIIECKTDDAVLSENQKEYIECLKNIKSDKVEYIKINVDYQLPKQLTVSEISHIP